MLDSLKSHSYYFAAILSSILLLFASLNVKCSESEIQSHDGRVTRHFRLSIQIVDCWHHGLECVIRYTLHFLHRVRGHQQQWCQHLSSSHNVCDGKHHDNWIHSSEDELRISQSCHSFLASNSCFNHSHQPNHHQPSRQQQLAFSFAGHWRSSWWSEVTNHEPPGGGGLLC